MENDEGSLMIISVCVGSYCHLQGSYDISDRLKDRISEEKLEDQMEVRAAFCLGKCGSHGVSMKFDDEVVSGVTQDNFNHVFDQYVLKK